MKLHNLYFLSAQPFVALSFTRFGNLWLTLWAIGLLLVSIVLFNRYPKAKA